MYNTARLQEHVMRVSSLNDGRQLLAMPHTAGLDVRDVQCQDGTCWKVNSGLAWLCPGSRTAAVPDTYGEDGGQIMEKPECAQIGIQFRTSVVSRCIVEE